MDAMTRQLPRRGYRLLTTAAGMSLVATSLLYATGASAAGGEPTFGIEVAAPGNAAANPGAYGAAVACGAPGSCFQVGFYIDSSGYQQPSLGVIADGSAEQYFSLAGVVPANASTTPSGDYLSGISCPNVAQCEVAGTYSVASGGQAPYAFEWDAFGGYDISPSSVVEISLPADAASTPSGSLYAVSCWSAGNCVGVGSYASTSSRQPLIATESNGTWHQGFTPASEPSGFSNGTLYGVSCPTANNCFAVGRDTVSGKSQAITYQLTNGTWQSSPVLAPLPNDVNTSSPEAGFNAVSCLPSGACEAVGSYRNATNNVQPLTLQRAAGNWQSPATVTLPADSVSPSDGELYSVSCIATDGLCEATGYYSVTGGYNSMAVLDRGGTWRGAQTVVAPVGFSSTPPETGLYGVACQQSGTCVAAGGMVDWLGDQQAMMALVNMPPSPVTSISVKQTSPSTATVSWVPSAVTGAGTDHFEVYESDDGGSTYGDLGSPGSGTSFAVSGLMPGHTYHFEVVAVDVATHLGASLSWTAPANSGGAPVTSYRITLTWPGGSSVKMTTATRLSLAGLSHSKTYSFTVRALNRGGLGAPSAAVHFTPGA